MLFKGNLFFNGWGIGSRVVYRVFGERYFFFRFVFWGLDCRNFASREYAFGN